MIKTCASLRALYDSFMTLILQLCYKATEWELCCINTNAYGQVSDPMYFVEEIGRVIIGFSATTAFLKIDFADLQLWRLAQS